MEQISNNFLTKRQALQKYSFLTENMLKNMLSRNLRDFRGKVVRRWGRRILLNEEALLQFIDESKGQ